MEFNTIPEAVADIRKGKLIVVVDDKERENEGDVVFAASKSTAAKINFLAKHARGLICVALTSERVEELRLPPMAETNLSRHDTAFTVSVEVREGTTTGISASDRSATSKALGDPAFGHEDFIRPGHVFPLKARKGGVLVRAGHTEAAVDLVNMAGLGTAGVICEIMNENGTMARLKDSVRFAKRHKLKIISVEDLISYRRIQEKLIRRVAAPDFPTPFGDFKSYVYEDVIHGRKHMALVRGELTPGKTPNVRVHSECLTGDVFGSERCDCGGLLHAGLEYIGREGGIFLYMRQVDAEGDFARKMEGFDLADADRREAGKREAGKREAGKREAGKREAKTARSSKPAARLGAGKAGTGKAASSERGTHHGLFMDVRTYGIGAQILYDLGVRRLNLLTNNPKRIQGLEGYGLKIVKQSPLAPKSRAKSAASAAMAVTASATTATKTVAKIAVKTAEQSAVKTARKQAMDSRR